MSGKRSEMTMALALGLLQEDLRNFEKTGGRVALVAHRLEDGQPAAIAVLVGATVVETPEGLMLAPADGGTSNAGGRASNGTSNAASNSAWGASNGASNGDRRASNGEEGDDA